MQLVDVEEIGEGCLEFPWFGVRVGCGGDFHLHRLIYLKACLFIGSRFGDYGPKPLRYFW